MKYIFSLKCKNNMIKYNNDLKYMKIDKKQEQSNPTENDQKDITVKSWHLI